MKRIMPAIFFAAAASLAAEAQQWDSLYYRPDRHVAPIERTECRRSMEFLGEGRGSLDVIETIPGGRPGTIVYIYHGNAENISGEMMRQVMSVLTEAGYAVRAVDYPGFGRSTGTPTHEPLSQTNKTS